MAILFASAVGSADPLTRVHHRQIHMGVQVEITAFAPDAATGDAAAQAAYARIEQLDGIMSDYRPASELMRLCAQAGGPPVAVSRDLFTVLQRALDISQRSEGAFDITVGPYVRLWRRMRRTGEMPTREEWRAAGELVGWRKVILDSERQTVRLRVPGMALDLGGIAKGYALDQGLLAMRARGVTRGLLHAGGDIAAGDAPPGRDGWRVEVAYAGPDRRWLTVANCGVSSSGDTEQVAQAGAGRYSHIIDPRWGRRRARPLVATLVAPEAPTSDGWATAAVVLGESRGTELLRTIPGVVAYIRTAD